MGSYINTGAFVNGRRPASKKALREAIKADPSSVTFDSTAMAGARAGDMIKADPDDIGKGNTLSVAGPDPYTRRNWYASVQVSASGALKVS
jgi:hypothetical protein